ncbi:hypothetical protein L21SP5_02528 [Salinivirga cyanobacteriivorans]|uniref:Uncharacterized protein n=1 Tax=Salinivirga cyanobacteriivorans TaxID=1307839 RepID=A0A0S2I1A9_9BACT|nr:hypothetical protein L21SP5_02528 [Salinivirga cyanobacteriivorans]
MRNFSYLIYRLEFYFKQRSPQIRNDRNVITRGVRGVLFSLRSLRETKIHQVLQKSEGLVQNETLTKFK